MGVMDQQFAEDFAACFADVAEPGVYRPLGGRLEFEILVEVQNRQVQTGAVAGGEFADLLVLVTEVPRPQLDDEFDVAGETWKFRPNPAVQIMRKKDGPCWTLRCSRDVTMTHRR